MGALLNLIGLSAGVVLYAMLLLMVVRAGRAPSGSFRADPLLLATAFLGLVWNLCALPAFALTRLGITGPLPFLTLVGTSALGFLPAVVVHSVLRGARNERHRIAVWTMLAAAYGVGTVAAALHLHAALTGQTLPSPTAMRLLTVAFIALLVPVGAVTRGQPGARRAFWVAALSAFAVSALHLSQQDPANPSWVIELVGHHASLPLAFAILYQDFPFALADIFLKRALALLALVATPFGVIAILGVRSSAAALPLGDPRVVAIVVTLWVTTLLLYPRLRDLSEWFVDTVVLNRPDYASIRTSVGRSIQSLDNVPAMLDEVCAQLTPALSARVVRWREGDETAAAVRRPDRAVIEIPVAEAPRYAVEIADLVAGRRLLSDDYAFLDAIAAVAGRRINALRITRERYARELREQEIGKLATEAELRALRSQINPHFLFNALTTIGYLIQTSPPRALRTLMRLTTLLRGVLGSDGELTTLGRELDLIESYLDIERARFEHRLRVRVDVPVALRALTIPSLILQPLVENAVKHGVGQQQHGGDVVVTARLDDDPGDPGDHVNRDASPMLSLVVRDTGAGASPAELRRGREAGVGLNNIARRLACHYGAASALTIASEPGAGTTVEIRMPAAFKTAGHVASEHIA
jgi:two-component system LytT family sensor kinase